LVMYVDDIIITCSDKEDIHRLRYSNTYWAGCLVDKRSTNGYCVFLDGNLVAWKSKKQHVVYKSSVEAKYRAIAYVAGEIMWLRMLLSELGLPTPSTYVLHCGNQSAIHIASNPVFHERTKHIEVDYHFIREKVQSKEIFLQHTRTEDQLADLFTRSLRGSRVVFLCDKLGLFDMYAPT
ncbi:hypothetical protein CFOL_v3_00473, partial [Cephalotus follicularis]